MGSGAAPAPDPTGPVPTPSLAAAISAVQAQLPEIRKGETAEVETKTGRKYRYQYADLADVSKVILPILGRHGLSWITRPTLVDGRMVLAYELLHTSGDSRTGEYPLPVDGTPQELGSAITYARRYALCSVTGVAPAADDDDGAAASRRRDDWDDARSAAAERQHARIKILANAARAIAAAADRDALDVIGRRITDLEGQGALDPPDGVDLRRALVARLEKLHPTAVAVDEGGQE